MSVYTKLNDAREKFHALKLVKTGHNKFAGYNYFELGDFLVPALTVFREVGLCAIVSFDKDVATMTIHDIDLKSMGQGPQTITITSPMGSAALKGCHEVQNIGAVETYQRRYLWVAALEIVEHDALDATTGADKKITGPAGVKGAVLDGLPPLDEGEKEWYRELADRVAKTLANAGAGPALDLVELEQLDNEQKIHLSTFMDSKANNALKAESLARRKAT